MTSFPYFVVDAFTRARFTGNPAGVVLHDGALTDGQMQQVAGELGLETAFLTPTADRDADYRVVYYTGVRRIPLCGHDTIAAVTVLAHLPRIERPGAVRFATDIGVLTVETRADGTAWMTQAPPEFGRVAQRDGAAAALGMDAAQIIGPPQVVSTGSPFLFVPVRERAALDALRPEQEPLAPFCEALGALGAYVWTGETLGPEAFAYARCFAPGAGLPEDPVTGSASGALGAYLLRHGLAMPDADGVLAFVTQQGYAMGRGGGAQVRVETRGEEITRVQVGGPAVIVAEGRLWV